MYIKKALLSLSLITILLTSTISTASEISSESAILKRISALEERLSVLEKRVENTEGKDRWRDNILWKRLKVEMPIEEVEKLLGKAGRIENQIFTSWYFHPTSKLHSFVWFDEGILLGWEAPK